MQVSAPTYTTAIRENKHTNTQTPTSADSFRDFVFQLKGIVNAILIHGSPRLHHLLHQLAVEGQHEEARVTHDGHQVTAVAPADKAGGHVDAADALWEW